MNSVWKHFGQRHHYLLMVIRMVDYPHLSPGYPGCGGVWRFGVELERSKSEQELLRAAFGRLPRNVGKFTADIFGNWSMDYDDKIL